MIQYTVNGQPQNFGGDLRMPLLCLPLDDSHLIGSRLACGMAPRGGGGAGLGHPDHRSDYQRTLKLVPMKQIKAWTLATRRMMRVATAAQIALPVTSA